MVEMRYGTGTTEIFDITCALIGVWPWSYTVFRKFGASVANRNQGPAGGHAGVWL